ncbi:MAG: tyrosyl-DNA phosphodiesterase, partial [Halobacteriaceae archaeon]
GNLIAQFDDSLSVYSSVRKYARTLPNEARAQQDGKHIQIKAEENLENWLPFNPNQKQGLLAKIF